SKEEENYNNQKITNEKLNAIKIINEYNNLLKQKNTLQQCELNYNLLKKIENEYQILSKKYDEELLNFYNAQAYILSQKLKKDERCPVCGSKNHPILPNKPEKYLNEIEINEIKNQLNILAQTVKNYETNFAISFENCKQFFNVDNKDIIEIFKLIKNIENQIIASKTNFLNCNKLISSFDTEDAILKEHEKNNNIADSLLTQKNKAIIELNLPLETLKIDVLNACKKNEELQKNYKTKSENINYKIKMYKIDFEKAREEYNKTNTNLKSITDMLEKLEMIGKKSRKEAVLYSKMFLENCLKNGFNNENDFIEIYEQIYLQDDIEKRINDFEDKYLSAQKVVEFLQEQLKETDKPIFEVIIKQMIDIKEIIKLIDKKISDNTLKYQSNKNNLEKLEKEFDKYQDVEKNVSKYEKLYDVSRGKNSQKLSFESYILSAYFKYIINTANLRLQKMTDSRYKLYKKEELARNGASSGLEMTVFDAYTGKTRETSTLSGGESFKVSLSLALGLADIIEQSSGGIFIETMFIDEGFGSLDSSSLDNAINTLFDLKNNGRLVGIISHVESLKEKIETKLIVESNNGGSTAYFSKK
ncbi:MAG: SbcC/MukB-like Walker B domain-containing protein, partial [Oscillospiraceae bacterium]